MKRWKKNMMVILLAALVLSCFPGLSVKAEDGSEGYTYTVRFFSGRQGTFGGQGEVIVKTGLRYGDRVTFDRGKVQLNNGSKYYVKGIRESGKDNNTVNDTSFTVEGDRDYVVAYGLLGDAVGYTVRYVDKNGEKLAPDDIYYGNVGDKPVVAFLYINGYQPQAYNLTKTLSANEAENVFTFVYVPLTGDGADEEVIETIVDGGTVVQVIPGRTRRTETRRSVGGENTSTVTDDGTGRSTGGTRVTVGERSVVTAGNTEETAEPVAAVSEEPFASIDLDGIELDDAVVPLANRKFKLGPIEMDAKMLLILFVIIADLLLMAGVSYWYWKPYMKRKNDEEQSASQPV